MSVEAEWHCCVLQVPESAPNTGAEVRELQLMAENQVNLEATTEQGSKNDRSSHTGAETNAHGAHTLDRQWTG